MKTIWRRQFEITLFILFSLGTALENSDCYTETVGDTTASEKNFRLKLSPQDIDTKQLFVKIPKLSYCHRSGIALTVCDPAAVPRILILDHSAALVIREIDSQPANLQLDLYCKFENNTVSSTL